MNRRALLVLAGVALIGATAVQATQSGRAVGGSASMAVDKVLADAVTRGDIPGVVAMAIDRRSVIYRATFGTSDLARQQPLAVDAIFRIASMTKPITSAALMQLVERGRLSLDDPAGKYLPELGHLSVFDSFDPQTGAYTVHPATKTLTVRQLLTHTSGLGYNFTSPVVRDFKPSPGQIYGAGPLLFEPGEQWIYGTSTDWVGRLVEAVSGTTLDAYFREHILGPLGMTDTFFNVPEDKQLRLVTLHRRQSDGRLAVDPRQPASPPVTRFSGGGGLSSTAADYVRFMQMVLNDGTLDGVRVLSPDTVRLMGQNQIGNIGVRALKTAMPQQSSDFTFIADGRDKWGLGFMITADHHAGKRSAGSLSWGGIDNTYFWIDRERGIAGVILMQFLPFADTKALAVYDAFERAIYGLASQSNR